MPHVIVKMISGRSDELKTKLAQDITKVVMKATGNSEESVSVSIEDVASNDWTEEVYRKDIMPNWDNLYKKPGYDPL